ncbi:MAG TPA: DUF2339 domain-containing protein [Thermoanaerobaculia bacterium]|nr:DUF2339 domain-containing protein [Thermoanaerobaculia bacterium]
MIGFLILVLFVGAIIAFGKIHDLQLDSRAVRKELEDLRNELASLRRHRPAEPASEPIIPTVSPAPAPAPAAPPPMQPTYTPAPPIQASARSEAPAFAGPPPAQATAPTVVVPPPIVPPPIVPPPIAPPPPKRPSPPPAAPKKPFDWESIVGVKLFSWIAGISLVLAAVFFLKYSVEHGWLSPTIRAILGLMTGTALLVICELRVARNYAVTANALHGAGIAILYSTLFATYAMWHLLSGPVVFALMLVVTAVAVMLSIRRDSVLIALLGLMGGFATPALLSTGENRPIGLFSYLLLLNLGLAWVAFRKGWPALTFGSLLFTVAYQWGWTAKFLTASQLPLAATIFGVFAVAGTSALWLRRGFGPQGAKPKFERTAIGSAILPLAFAVFGSAVPAYGARYNVLFTFLLLMTAGLAVIAMIRGPKWLHALGGGSVLITFIVWSAVSYNQRAFPAVLAWIAAFVILYLAAGLRLKTQAVLTAGILFFMFPVLAAAEPATKSPLVLFATMFALLAMTGAYAIFTGSGGAYFVAAFFAIVTEGVWSASYLSDDRLDAALIIYGVFALTFLGIPVLARRFGRTLDANGTAFTVILALCVLFFLTGPSVAASALWGLALLLAVLLTGTFVEASAACRPWLAAIAILLGWMVLASWWNAAPIVPALIPALAVIAIFAVIALSGIAWAVHRDTAAGFEPAAYLVLPAYLFLMFVAAQQRLAIPPWPLFAVLAVVALAIGTTALYLRRGALVIGAAVATQIVLIIWSQNATLRPWPNVALAAGIVAAAYAVLWYALAHRVCRSEEERFLWAAILGLFTAHIVAIAAGRAPVVPLFGTLLTTHAVLVIAVLALAWITERHEIVIIDVALAGIGTALARLDSPSREFSFAVVLYALFVAYPLLLGARAKRRFEPYLAAVLASVPFFFFARDAMKEGGLDWCIGILPVGQAIVMMLLLGQLLRIERPGQRQLTRLATVTATALAFITVAIPLQLDKQWITIGWALEAAALVWLFKRIPHRGLIGWAATLFAIVFVRLVFNPAVFSYHPASHTAVFNWYLYTYLVSAIAFFVAAYLWPRDIRLGVPATTTAGTVLLFVLLNIEIADFYSRGPNLTFNFFSSSLAQDLTYTIGWAIFAIAMLIAGIVMHTRSARVAALLLLVVTILKCFLHDLARLGGLYRVGSLLGLAVSLVLVGVLLQKFVMVKRAAPAGETA